ncbi:MULTISPECIES: PP2C family protein-serine/threonine phosphatase [Auritidibacter]|uniref:Protein phosphatase 2C domain-containing protein n=2 Tax=Micrococcaceae TaxID=1268 RepID=A0AAJ6AK94_9MICC|nr:MULTISPECIES: PP2C family serine/threonine-protein phosphatase [Auritidibacter]PXA76517.1 serine/threonine protein phosphatase [Auritidibacter sp. NML100628]PXA77307.1 serine/threonine protein phosphatase [Auritidibacter sp. NML120779]AXR74425.1 serine/threonine-protein phosphatase [Auritidibacter sp. NML130574]NIH72677.1 protein phosphatase [Auritidibacter ignavus]PXA79336.1 serine/threonine protein phosphatase [Auritidibacter sp. NML120636]
MALMLNFAARSDVGRVRAKNDDSAYVGRYFAVVADGMGGHVGGDVASASTVLDLAPLDRPDQQDPENVLADEIQSANLILNDLVNTNPKLAGMGTTCTALLVDHDQLHMAHIGDSRAYRLKNDTFEQISKDHTFVQRLIDEGRLDPADAESHPHKNVLMRVLGDVDASPELDVSTFAAQPGERWLLCSDGLNAVVADNIIEEKLRSADDIEQAVEELVDLTLAGGSPDNVTVVIFETVPEDETSRLAPVEEDTTELTRSAREISESDPQSPVSAALLRHDLGKRPHLLVGAAALATDTDQIPIVTRSSSAKRAAALLHGTPQALDAPRAEKTYQPIPYRTLNGTSEDFSDDTDTSRPRGRNWPLIAALLTIVVLIVGGGIAGYLWSQNQYYVGVDGDHVAVYRGVAQDLGPIELSQVEETTDIPLDRLPGYTRQRVESGLTAQDLNHAHDILEDLRSSMIPEAPPVELPSPQPTDPDIPEVSNSRASGAVAGATGGAIGGTGS